MRKRITVMLLALLTLLVSACAGAPGQNQPDSAGGYNAAQIFEQFSAGTVHIESSTGGGTGFFITENVIATNNHVIAGAQWLTVKTVDGKIYDVTTVLASSEQPDLALLQIDGTGTPLKMNTHGIQEGEPVYCIGAPMGIFPCISDGIVTKSSHMDLEVEYILSNFHSIGGNSGGPVLNAYGEVIGVVVGGMSDGTNSIDMVIHGKYLDTLDRSTPIRLDTKAEWAAQFNQPDEENYEIADLATAQPGQLVTFGRYEQDNDESNGPEEILWLVTGRQDGVLTLMSLYCLDVVPYNLEYTDTTWETSYVREFLNGEFFDRAFSPEEQKQIADSPVVNTDNVIHGTPGGNDTLDKVYLPSLEEVMDHYGITEPVEMFYDQLYAQATAYAMQKGVWLEMEGSSRCWWWLRSSGGTLQNACEVGSLGYLSFNGTGVDNPERAIRPVIQVNVQS